MSGPITMPKDALKCPFCGAKARMESWHGGGPNKKLVYCGRVRCHVHPSVSGESAEEAIKLWNKRS